VAFNSAMGVDLQSTKVLSGVMIINMNYTTGASMKPTSYVEPLSGECGSKQQRQYERQMRVAIQQLVHDIFGCSESDSSTQTAYGQAADYSKKSSVEGKIK